MIAGITLPFSAADFLARASAGALHGVDHGDFLLNPDFEAQLKAQPLKDAAVLIGLRETGAGGSVILTQRTAHLRQHAGQVAFPGGAIDPEDGTAEIAAMREAQEEIGLDPQLVRPIGRLPDYLTSTGFRIKPVLALVDQSALLTPNPDEVDAVFEVPLAFLMDLDNHKRESRVWQGIERHYFSLHYGERFIWGVTAGIIHMMHERLYD